MALHERLHEFLIVSREETHTGGAVSAFIGFLNFSLSQSSHSLWDKVELIYFQAKPPGPVALRE